MANPLDSIEDNTEKDIFLDDANFDIYSGALEEEPEAYNQCFFS